MLIVRAAEEPKVFERGFAPKRDRLDVVDFELITGFAFLPTGQILEGATPLVAFPDLAPEGGGDVTRLDARLLRGGSGIHFFNSDSRRLRPGFRGPNGFLFQVQLLEGNVDDGAKQLRVAPFEVSVRQEVSQFLDVGRKLPVGDETDLKPTVSYDSFSFLRHE